MSNNYLNLTEAREICELYPTAPRKQLGEESCIDLSAYTQADPQAIEHIAAQGSLSRCRSQAPPFISARAKKLASRLFSVIAAWNGR